MKKPYRILSALTGLLLILAGICNITVSEPNCDPPRHLCGTGSQSYCELEKEPCR